MTCLEYIFLYIQFVKHSKHKGEIRVSFLVNSKK